jgi:exodeoxyribonuclease III
VFKRKNLQLSRTLRRVVVAAANDERAPTMGGTKNKSDAANADAASGDAGAGANSAKKQKVASPSGPIAQTPCARRVEAAMGAKTFKAIAWNIAGMRSFVEKHMEKLAGMIASEDPDCVCLEEHKLQASHVDAMTETLRKTFPQYKTVHFAVSTVKKGYSGVMVMCKASMVGKKGVQTSLDAMFGAKPKTEPTDTKTYDGPKLLAISEGLDGGYVDEGRVLTLEYESFYVVMAYVPNSGQDLKRLDYRIDEWERDMRAHLAHLESKGKPVLYIGDLNVAHLDADIWNVGAPHIKKSAGTTPRERETFGVMLEKNAFVDAFRKFHADATGWFSFWSQRAGNRPVNKGLRLDYTLASQSLFGESELRVVDAFILDKVMGSDHAPVGMTLALPN